jgi:hypothetical protein
MGDHQGIHREIENQKNVNPETEKKGEEIGCKKITKIKRGVRYRRKDAV